MTPRVLLGPVLAALVLCPAPARALSCTAAVPPLAFGTYNVFSASPLNSGGTVTVTCSSLLSIFVSFDVTLSAGSSGTIGSSGGGGNSARTMTNGAATLAYQVYVDSARSRVWGSSSQRSSQFTGGYLLDILFPVVTSFDFYAQIPARQNVPPGLYTDMLVVTVTY